MLIVRSSCCYCKREAAIFHPELMAPSSRLSQIKLLFKEMRQIRIFKCNVNFIRGFLGCLSQFTQLKMQKIVIWRRLGMEVVTELPVVTVWMCPRMTVTALNSTKTATAGHSAAAQQPELGATEKTVWWVPFGDSCQCPGSTADRSAWSKVILPLQLVYSVINAPTEAIKPGFHKSKIKLN